MSEQHEYGYWSGDTYVHGLMETTPGKSYWPMTRGVRVAIGDAEYGPVVTLDIALKLGRKEFSPTEVPSMSDRIHWFLAGLDDDRRKYAEDLVDMVERW